MEKLNQKVEEQNKAVTEIISQEKLTQEVLSKKIDEEISNLSKYISELNELNPPKFKNPLVLGLSSKINEFNTIITQNSVVLVPKQRYKTMEQNRALRNNTTHL